MQMTAAKARKNMPTKIQEVEREINEIELKIFSLSSSGEHSMYYNYKHVNNRGKVNMVLKRLKKNGFKVVDNYPGDSMYNDLSISWS